MKFELHIDGLAGLEDRDALVEALDDVKKHLLECDCTTGEVRSELGNVVGRWCLTEETHGR